MRQKTAVPGYLLIAVLAGAVWGCDQREPKPYAYGHGEPQARTYWQREPQLYPYGHGLKSLQVNCEARAGLIRPLIGTNRGPVNWPGSPQATVWDFSENFRQFGIQDIRTHDFYGPTDWWVIFPDFTADANTPGGYDFASSDQRIGAIHDAGFGCFYRLGTSWKGDNPLPINDPPGTVRNQNGQVVHEADVDDFKKFANICTNIVRHYNQGWNSGHNYGIGYWEIWNEPDMPLQFWTGTPGQYYMLYEETAKAIKALDPSLKVGGPGLSGAFKDIYLNGLARWCRKTNTPLDFYSWHSYGGRDDYNPYCYYKYARLVRDALNRYGFKHAESIVTEWNAGIKGDEFSDTPAGVAYYASSLMNMLDGGVSRAYQYVGDNAPMLGLHNHAAGKPVRATQSLIAWKRMQDTPLRLAAIGSDKKGYNILAGTNEPARKVQILISDYQSSYSGWALSVTNLPWSDTTPYQATRWVLDPSRTELEAVETVNRTGRTFVLKRNMSRRTICLIEIRKTWPKRQTKPLPRTLKPKRVPRRPKIRPPRRRPPPPRKRPPEPPHRPKR
jgi:xylan 1,4-beta-xylosidase